MPRFCLIWRCPLHRFFLLNTLHNCWKGGSRQRSIRNQSAQVRLFSANMIKIRSFISDRMPFASILSAEYAAQLLERGKPSEINQKPIGTGPFIFRKYDQDSIIYF